MRRRLLFLTGVVLATLGFIACGAPRRYTGDVGEIREAGVLRVVVRPGFHTSPMNVEGGSAEAAVLAQLASRLGVEIRWIDPDRHD